MRHARLLGWYERLAESSDLLILMMMDRSMSNDPFFLRVVVKAKS